MKTCILFPGQGAQAIGMGKDLFDASKKVRDMFEEASEASKIDLAALVFNGTEEALKQTRNTQVALALVECAASAIIHERGTVIQGAGGFSLGEWPALVEAGVLGFGEMIRLVHSLAIQAHRRKGSIQRETPHLPQGALSFSSCCSKSLG